MLAICYTALESHGEALEHYRVALDKFLEDRRHLSVLSDLRDAIGPA